MALLFLARVGLAEDRALFLDRLGDDLADVADVALAAEDTIGQGIWLSVANAVLELTRPADEQDLMN